MPNVLHLTQHAFFYTVVLSICSTMLSIGTSNLLYADYQWVMELEKVNENEKSRLDTLETALFLNIREIRG